MGCAFSVREYLHSAPTSAREAATRLFGATPRGRGSSSVSRVSAMGFLTDSQLEDTMRKFEQFDKDRSGYIEQNELDGLKSLFSMKELDVGVEDGRISRAEFVAGLHRLPYELAKSQVDGHMDKLALAQRLQAEVQPIMEKFDAFDKDANGFIEGGEMDGLKKLFSLNEVDVVTVDGKIDRVEFMAAIMKCSPAAADAAVKKWTFMKRLRANLDDAMAKFAKFDTDSSGFIEANELNGLKKLFDINEIDVGVRDGKIGRAEFFAALYDGYPSDAQIVIDERAMTA